MKHQFLRSIFVSALAVSTLVVSASRGGKGRAVGAGLSFPSSHQSLSVNAAGLSENSGISLQGLWGLEANQAAVSLVGSQSQIGWGLGFKDSGATNEFDAGFGLNLGKVMIGTDLYTTDFNGLNADISTIIDFKRVRFAAAVRGVQGGLDRVNLGLGINVGKLLMSFDVAKDLPIDEADAYILDVSAAYNVGDISVGMGYDFTYLSGVKSGHLHADLSVMIIKDLALEGHYRLTPYYAGGLPEWSVGARLIF